MNRGEESRRSGVWTAGMMDLALMVDVAPATKERLCTGCGPV